MINEKTPIAESERRSITTQRYISVMPIIIIYAEDAMLTSAWLAESEDIDESIFTEQFLEIDIDDIYLPTPSIIESESEPPLNDYQSPQMKRRKKATNTTAPVWYYCPLCGKGFSRPHSQRRHQKLYCKHGKLNKTIETPTPATVNCTKENVQ
jgi:hypothetical protein